MSTVATFLDEISDRIPEQNVRRLFPALNRAIRLIQKRLYLHESDLVKAELSVPIYAEVSYTAATIAFVSNQPDAADTITDSAAQFVTEGFEAGMAVETDYTTNPGPYRIATVAAGTLTLDSTESVTAAALGTSWTLTSRDDFGYLPSDFWGLVGRAKPYIDGKTWPLQPLPTQDEKLVWGTSAGNPIYYEIIGDRFCVIPATASDITVKGIYFKKPATITRLSDTMPYYELFDDILQEYLIEIMTSGTAMGATIQDQLMLNVDLLISKREQKGSNPMPVGINWNNF